jgi:hypothetical protein
MYRGKQGLGEMGGKKGKEGWVRRARMSGNRKGEEKDEVRQIAWSGNVKSGTMNRN